MTPEQAALAEWLEEKSDTAKKVADLSATTSLQKFRRERASEISAHLATFRALVEENEGLKCCVLADPAYEISSATKER